MCHSSYIVENEWVWTNQDCIDYSTIIQKKQYYMMYSIYQLDAFC